MPSNIRDFHLNTSLNVFSFNKAEVRKDPPVEGEPAKKLTEVETLQRSYVIQTFIYSAYEFPTFSRSSPVTKIVTKELKPIESATKDIASKNADLEKKKTEKLEISAEFKSAFTMALKGIIDAAVNGGTAMYTEAFLRDFKRREKLEEDDDAPLTTDEDKLVDTMVDQVMLLRRGLDVHKKFCPENMIALHDTMETQFEALMDQLWKISYFERPNPFGEKDPEPEPEPAAKQEAILFESAGDKLERNISKFESLVTIQDIEDAIERTQSTMEAVQMMLRVQASLATPDSQAAAKDKVTCMHDDITALTELKRRRKSSPEAKAEAALQRRDELRGMTLKQLVAKSDEAKIEFVGETKDNLIRNVWEYELKREAGTTLQHLLKQLDPQAEEVESEDVDKLVHALLAHAVEEVKAPKRRLLTREKPMTRANRPGSTGAKQNPAMGTLRASATTSTLDLSLDDGDLLAAISVDQPVPTVAPKVLESSISDSLDADLISSIAGAGDDLDDDLAASIAPAVPSSPAGSSAKAATSEKSSEVNLEEDMKVVIDTATAQKCLALCDGLIGRLEDVAAFPAFFERVFKVFEGMNVLRAFEDNNDWDAVLCFKALPEAVKALDKEAPATALMIEVALSALKEHISAAVSGDEASPCDHRVAQSAVTTAPVPLSAPPTDVTTTTSPSVASPIADDKSVSDWEKLILG